MNPTIEQLNFILKSLTVYRKLLDDPVVGKLNSLIQLLNQQSFERDQAVSLYSELFYLLSKSDCGLCLSSYIQEKILLDENVFSLLAEKQDFLSIPSDILDAAAFDLSNLQLLCQFPSQAYLQLLLQGLAASNPLYQQLQRLPLWVSAQDASWQQPEQLAEFYRTHGCGAFSKYTAFVWKHSSLHPGLMGVESPDPIRLQDLIGYDAAREEVLRNTLKFIQGYPANNVLLYGDRGTGKSSTVKALLNEHASRGLRLIEVPKKHLIDFPQIMRMLKNRNQKFLLFVDDLAFEDNEENYTALKAVLEGGVENKPDNVLIYATSNRRHLIKERFSDRSGLRSPDREDEIRAADTIQEKLSLSDRFGITVVFSSPDQAKYLEIVEGIVQRRGLSIDPQRLRKEALQWELWYNGRSPRTARQFVDWLEGEVL